MLTLEQLQLDQPEVIHLLSRQWTQQRLPHAILLSGRFRIEETALFCAAYGVHPDPQNEAHQRVLQRTYGDLFLLDGAERPIRKEDILTLRERFSTTGMESSNQRVAILFRFDLATPEAANSLLKFLEEPEGTDIRMILTCDSETAVLPTIRSRCQVMRLRKAPEKVLLAQLEQEVAEQQEAEAIVSISDDPLTMLKQLPQLKEAWSLYQHYVQTAQQSFGEASVNLQMELGAHRQADVLVPLFLEFRIVDLRTQLRSQIDAPSIRKQLQETLTLKERIRPGLNMALTVDAFLASAAKEFR